MLVVAPRAPSQLHTKALWPCSGVQGWKWSEAMTEVKPFSSATLLQRKRSVGWNCSNIAAYPTVPVVSMSASLWWVSGFRPQPSACSRSALLASGNREFTARSRTAVPRSRTKEISTCCPRAETRSLLRNDRAGRSTALREETAFPRARAPPACPALPARVGPPGGGDGTRLELPDPGALRRPPLVRLPPPPPPHL